MKRFFLPIAFAILMLTLLYCIPLPAQNSNAVTVQVVAPPSWTITVSPASFYQNKSATLSITVTAGPVSPSCVATWDAVSLPLTFPSPLPTTNPVVLTAAVSASMTATLGNHAVVINCPLPILSMNSPVTLPNARQGVAYSANLSALASLSGGTPPYSFKLTSGSLPIGLSLSSAGNVTGMPSGVGSFSFQYTVTDSSKLATNQLQIDTWGRLDATHPVLLTWQQPQDVAVSGDPADGVLSAQAFNIYRRESPRDPTFGSTMNRFPR